VEKKIMKKNIRMSKVLFALILFFIFALSLHSYAQKNPMKLIPELITLDQTSSDSVKILNGPPETVTMRSGYMVLAPSKSVGRHSTRDNEEAIVVLSGTGEMNIIGGSTLHLRPYCVAYCPPNTEHDVVNKGTDTLRYIYIVARAKI
jgi:quercetin dioxygenase-like cupin family protein